MGLCRTRTRGLSNKLSFARGSELVYRMVPVSRSLFRLHSPVFTQVHRRLPPPPVPSSYQLPLTRVLLLTVSCFWLSSPPPGQIQRERRRRLAPSGALFSISLFASSRLKWIRFKAPTMSSSTPKLSFPRLLPNRSVNSAKTTTFPRRPNRRLQQTESWPEALTPSPCDPTCFSVASYDRPFPPPPPSLGPNTPAAESSINPSVTCTLSVPAAD